MAESNSSLTMKCRRCRRILLEHPNNTVINAHGTNLTDGGLESDGGECMSLKDNSLWYLQENTVPDWISLALTKEQWTRGKLTCPYCSTRLGSFDFVSGDKCACEKFVIPAVHIVKSKVDIPIEYLRH